MVYRRAYSDEDSCLRVVLANAGAADHNIVSLPNFLVDARADIAVDPLDLFHHSGMLTLLTRHHQMDDHFTDQSYHDSGTPESARCVSPNSLMSRSRTTLPDDLRTYIG
jgi:hypothetical protein